MRKTKVCQIQVHGVAGAPALKLLRWRHPIQAMQGRIHAQAAVNSTSNSSIHSIFTLRKLKAKFDPNKPSRPFIAQMSFPSVGGDREISKMVTPPPINTRERLESTKIQIGTHYWAECVWDEKCWSGDRYWYCGQL